MSTFYVFNASYAQINPIFEDCEDDTVFETRFCEVDAPPIYIEEFDLAANTWYLFRTYRRDDDSGMDEVLHLMADTNGLWTQVASNNDYCDNASCGAISPLPCHPTHSGEIDPTACIYYRTGNIPKKHLLIVRARSQKTSGRAWLRVGHLSRPDEVIPVGGVRLSRRKFAPVSGGRLMAVPRPGGSEWPMVLALRDELNVARVTYQGPAGATQIGFANTDSFYVVGTPVYRKGDDITIARAGQAAMYANDIMTDIDGDGVGNQLEAALNTCSDARFPPSQDDCPHTVTSMDTDRDGLPDGEELFGYLGENPDSSDDIAFPRYGANPRHKDVFLIAAWWTTLDPLNIGKNPFERPVIFSTDPNASAIDWVQDLRAPFLEGPAHHLHNPDGRDGLEIHVDFGLDPEVPSDERFYGILSKNVVYAINRKWVADFKGPVDDDILISVNGQPGTSFSARGLTPVGIAFNVAWRILSFRDENVKFDSFIFNIRDLFNARLVMDTSVPGEHLDIQLAFASGVDSGTITFGFEGDRSVRNHVDDPAYMPPELAKRTRYVVLAQGGQAASAAGRLISQWPVHTVIHELGHTIGLSHWGHNQWLSYDVNNATPYLGGDKGDFNCLPSYHSTMNYIFGGPNYRQFSKLEIPIVLNSSNLREELTFFPYAMDKPLYSSGPFNLVTHPSLDIIDWNLNGIFDLAATSAPFRFAHHKACPGFKIGGQVISEPSANKIHPLTGSMDIVRAGNYIYVFYIREIKVKDGFGKIFYRRALLGPQGSASCRVELDNPVNYPENNPDTDFNESMGDQLGCLRWEPEVAFTSASNDEAQHLSTFVWDNKLFVAYLSQSNQVVVRWYATLPNIGQSFLQLFGTGQGKPELALIYGDQADWQQRLALVYSSTSTSPSQYQAHYLNQKGFFELWFNFGKTMTGTNLEGTGSPSLIAWPDTNNTQVAAADRLTCGIFPQTDKRLGLYCLDPITLEWKDLTNQALGGGPVPVESDSLADLAFRYTRSNTGAPLRPDIAMGNFQLTVTRPTQWNEPTLWISSGISTETSNHPLTTLWNFRWIALFTGDAKLNIPLYEDSFMGGTFALSLQADSLMFYPHADGTPNVNQAADSDFRVMEDYLCDWMSGPSVVSCYYNNDINVFE